MAGFERESSAEYTGEVPTWLPKTRRLLLVADREARFCTARTLSALLQMSLPQWTQDALILHHKAPCRYALSDHLPQRLA